MQIFSHATDSKLSISVIFQASVFENYTFLIQNPTLLLRFGSLFFQKIFQQCGPYTHLNTTSVKAAYNHLHNHNTAPIYFQADSNIQEYMFWYKFKWGIGIEVKRKYLLGVIILFTHDSMPGFTMYRMVSCYMKCLAMCW